jgi:hypothetical protein
MFTTTTMSNREEGRAIARQELRKRASWPALNMVKCMWRQPHPPVEFAVIRLGRDGQFWMAIRLGVMVSINLGIWF